MTPDAPLRILEVTHYMPPHTGGIERVAASLVDGLSARGHHVRWISSATPAPVGDDGRHLRVSAVNVLEERVGVPYPVWGPRGLARLAAAVRWAQVVHVHDCLYMGSAAAVAAARILGRPVLLTQHVGYVPFGKALDAVQGVAYRSLGRAVLTGADHRVACSAHVPEHFATLGVDGFQVIPNAIDDARFRPPSPAARAAARAAWAPGATGPVVLFVGRLVPKKGLDRALAVPRALASFGVTTVVVGDGPLAGLLTGVPGVVHHPVVAPERMPELYAAADVFLLPSAGEGLPLSVQEAMMTGLPVVVSTDPSYLANLSGAPGVTCCATEPELVSAVRAALATPPSGAAWATERWGGDGFVRAYEGALRGLVEAASVRP